MAAPRRFTRRAALQLTLVGAGAAILAACAAPAPTPTTAPAQPAQPAAAPPTATPATAAPAQPTPTPAPAKPTTVAPTATPAPVGVATPTAIPAATPYLRQGVKAIEFWFQWGGMTGINAIRTVANRFNEKTTAFQINSLQVAQLPDKMLTAIAGGTPPDVAVNGPYAEFWARGAALSLDDRINASAVIKRGDFFEANWRLAGWKGKTYGVPVIECFLRWGLSWNEELVEKAGLNREKPPQTFDELYEWHTKITTFDQAKNVKVLGFDPMDAMAAGAGGANPFFYGAAWGFKHFDEEKLQFNFDNPDFVDVLTTIKRFYDFVGAEKVDGFRKSYGTWTQSPTASFPSGVEGLIINGYWQPGELVKSAPGRKFGYSWVPMPTKRKGVKLQAASGHYSYLPKGSKAQDEGFQFIEYLVTDPAMDIIFAETGWLGAKKAYVAKIDPKTYPGLDFYIRSATEATEMVGSAVDPIQAFTYNQWVQAVDKVKFGDRTPEQAAKELHKTLNDEIRKRGFA